MSIMKRLVQGIRWIGKVLILFAAMVAIAWSFGAVWFDAPFGNANKVAAGNPGDWICDRICIR